MELLIVACLIGRPLECTERRIDATAMGLMGCVVASQQQAALLIRDELGPNWRVVKTRCGRPSVEWRA
jgi:hypothetical protein